MSLVSRVNFYLRTIIDLIPLVIGLKNNLGVIGYGKFVEQLLQRPRISLQHMSNQWMAKPQAHSSMGAPFKIIL